MDPQLLAKFLLSICVDRLIEESIGSNPATAFPIFDNREEAHDF